MSQGLKSVWKHSPGVLKIWALSQPGKSRSRRGSLQLGEGLGVLQGVPSGEIFSPSGGQLGETQPSASSTVGSLLDAHRNFNLWQEQLWATCLKTCGDCFNCLQATTYPPWKLHILHMEICRFLYRYPLVLVASTNCTVDENVETSLCLK